MASTVKVVVAPEEMVASCGWVVIDGAVGATAAWGAKAMPRSTVFVAEVATVVPVAASVALNAAVSVTLTIELVGVAEVVA